MKDQYAFFDQIRAVLHHVRGEWFKLPPDILARFISGKIYPFADNVMDRPSDEECYRFADECLATGKMRYIPKK